MTDENPDYREIMKQYMGGILAYEGTTFVDTYYIDELANNKYLLEIKKEVYEWKARGWRG